MVKPVGNHLKLGDRLRHETAAIRRKTAARSLGNLGIEICSEVGDTLLKTPPSVECVNGTKDVLDVWLH